jgi:CRP-like cAMP-binding protein
VTVRYAYRTSALLPELSSRELDAALASANVVELEPGAIALPADLPRVRLIVIEDGIAIIRTQHAESRREIVTCHAGRGSLVLPPGEGEALKALLPTRARTFDAAAAARLVAVPGAARPLFDALAATLRQKHQTIAMLASIHHVDRVRDKLVQLARDHGRVTAAGVRIDLPLTHDLLGQMVGSTRETVTRALEQLQEEGFVTRRGRVYTIAVDPDCLTV